MATTTASTSSPSVATRSDATRQPMNDPHRRDEQPTVDEGLPRSPEAFFVEVTKRPDVDEILRRLAAL